MDPDPGYLSTSGHECRIDFSHAGCEGDLSIGFMLKQCTGKRSANDQYQSYSTYTDTDIPGEGKFKEKTLGIPPPAGYRLYTPRSPHALCQGTTHLWLPPLSLLLLPLLPLLLSLLPTVPLPTLMSMLEIEQ